MAWLASICGILGAYIVALGYFLPGYSVFLISSGAWMVIAYRQKALPLGVMNFAFFNANLIGFYRALMHTI